ncbi:MAG: DEAD/DEAH box helicase [Nanoarchaeota archaeon]
MKTFEELGISKDLLKVLNKEGFTEPTEIQEKTIPLALAGKDIVGGSATGSGKTHAFASPIVENLKPMKTVQALILTPTRELAEQVSKAIENFSGSNKLVVSAVYGGVSIEPQIRKLSVADVVVGTPGRILDHLEKRTLKLSEVKILVLDEVDKMFDMGFHRDVEKIISQCPKNRQTMMFSATISGDIDHLARKYTTNAVEISAKSYVDSSKLKQVYYDVDSKMKFSLLVHLLKKGGSNFGMVFCSTRRNADFIAHNLQKIGINAMAIHGGLVQSRRIAILKDFHQKRIGILVCTDVAARGLDIKEVTHIYNYDIPPTAKEYTHRIGRTARAGKEGIAISLLSGRDYENFRNISKDSSLKIVKEEVPEFDKVEVSSNFTRREKFSEKKNFGRENKKPRWDTKDREDTGRRYENKPRRDDGEERNFRDKPRRSFGNRTGGRSSGRSFSRGRRDNKNNSSGRNTRQRSGGRSFRRR